MSYSVYVYLPGLYPGNFGLVMTKPLLMHVYLYTTNCTVRAVRLLVDNYNFIII